MALRDIAINIKATGAEQASGEMRKVRTATQQMADSLERAESRLLGFGAGVIGAASIEQVAQRSIEAALAMERIESAMSATFGKGQATARELQYVREEANRLGLVFNSTALSYTKFAASTRNTSIEGETTRKVFTGVAEAVTALQLTGEEADGIFLALSQMMSKGKVSAEELTGQLGERLPGALKLAADAMDMTTAELMKHMQQGEILSSDLLPKLAEELHKTYGTAAVESSQKAQAGINRFKNEVNETVTAMGKLLLKLDGLANWGAEGLKTVRENPQGPLDHIFRLIAWSETGKFVNGPNVPEQYANVDPQMSRILADQRANQETINAQRKATEAAAAKQAEADKEAEKAAKLADQQYQQYTRTLATFNKQVRDNNPYLSDMEKKLLDIDAATKQAIEDGPQYSENITQAGEAWKTNLKLSEQLKSAIQATSDEFKAMWAEWDSQLTAEPSRSSWEGAEALKEELELMKLTERERRIQIELRKLDTTAAQQYGEEVRSLVGQLYDEQQMMEKWKQTVDRMDQTFHDGFVRMMEDGKDGWEAFCKSLAHTFQAEVADYIYASMLKPLAGQTAGGIGGFINSMMSGSGNTATLDIPSSVTGLFPALNSSDDIGADIGTAMAPSVFTATKAGTSAGVSAGFSAAMPYLAVALGGYMAGSNYFGKGGLWNNSTTDQKWMRGLSMTNPIGWGALIADWATGGGLFGTDWKTKSQGVQLGVEDGDIGGQFYTTQKKKKSLWRGSKTRTMYDDLDAQWEEFINRQYESIINSMKVGAGMMGQDSGYVEQIMASFTSAATKINLNGKNAEEQQKAVEEYFRKVTNEALLALYPELEASIRLGEDAAAAWERLNDLRKTNNALLMQELDMVGQKGSAQYMELLNQQRELELLNMDETTQAIQRRVWALEDEQSAIKAMNTDMLDTALSAANLLKSLTIGNLSTGSPESVYLQTQQAFNSALAAGNLSAVTGLASSFLEASRSYNASGSAYVSDYNAVASALADIAGMPTTAELTLDAAQQQVQLLEDIRTAIETGNVVNLAGFSGKLNQDSAVAGSITPPSTTGSTLGDATMQSKANSIGDEVLNMALGLVAPNMKYDIAPLGSPDGMIDGGDALLWKEIALGQFKWSQTGLPAFASGGITSGLSLAGEAGPEAVVPLPDGRNIPVRMSDNYSRETIDELKEQNKLLREVVAELRSGTRVAQAVGTQLVELGEENNQGIKVLSREARMRTAK
jgi:tape measure domain